MSNDVFENDPQMKRYFMSLPKYVQESIRQSGVDITSLEQMQNFVKNLSQD